MVVEEAAQERGQARENDLLRAHKEYGAHVRAAHRLIVAGDELLAVTTVERKHPKLNICQTIKDIKGL